MTGAAVAGAWVTGADVVTGAVDAAAAETVVNDVDGVGEAVEAIVVDPRVAVTCEVFVVVVAADPQPAPIPTTRTTVRNRAFMGIFASFPLPLPPRRPSAELRVFIGVKNGGGGIVVVNGHVIHVDPVIEQSKKYRDVKRSGRAAIVVDDLASVDPWRPRGVEVRGRAEVVDDPGPMIRIHPDRVVSWGLDGDEKVE